MLEASSYFSFSRLSSSVLSLVFSFSSFLLSLVFLSATKCVLPIQSCQTKQKRTGSACEFKLLPATIKVKRHAILLVFKKQSSTQTVECKAKEYRGEREKAEERRAP